MTCIFVDACIAEGLGLLLGTEAPIVTPDGIHFSLSCLAEGEGKHSKPVANHSMTTAVALFDKTGDLIYMGQSKGSITVLDSASLKFLDILKVGTRPPCTIKAPIGFAFLLLGCVSTHRK